MNTKNKQTMYKLLRDLGNVQGIATMTILTLNSFIKSIRQLKCAKKETIPLYFELSTALKNSQPNIIQLMHLLEQFENEMQENMSHRDSSHQDIHQEQEETWSANMNFSMTTHSHDLVDLDLIDHLVTETGEIEKGFYPV